MKSLLIVVLSLMSSIAMADGFICQGADFRVKLYNQVDPNLGTRNPAVLIVSQRNVGTLAVLQGEDLRKHNLARTVVYGGRVNSRVNGHYLSVVFQIGKRPEVIRPGEERPTAHLAQLKINAEGARFERVLTCDRYLKHPKSEE